MDIASLDDDKTFTLMGITKTMQTVRPFPSVSIISRSCLLTMSSVFQVLSCFDEQADEVVEEGGATTTVVTANPHGEVNPAMLQIQEEIVPIIVETLKTQVLGEFLLTVAGRRCGS